MSRALPEPTDEAGDVKVRFLDYLDYYRSTVEAKVDGLSETQLRSTRLPSGWTAVELLAHLVHMERRWIRWGFLAERVDEPWGDSDADGRWRVEPDETVEGLLEALHAGGRRTRDVVEHAALDGVAATGGRFSADAGTPPTLAWILFHVLQEYARHTGHLDIVRELIDGEIGE